MTSSVTILDRSTLREVRAKVFRRQESTLADEAIGLSLVDFEATITGIRREFRALLVALPEAAFEAQPANVAGELTWSAGQVVMHVCDSATNVFGNFLRVAAGLPEGFRAPCVEGKQDYPLASRVEALALFDDCERVLADTFGSAPIGLDLATEATIEPMGTATIGATMMIFAIHEDDHLGQLQEIAERLA